MGSVNVKRQAMRFFVLIFSFLFAFTAALSAGEAFEAVKDGIQGAIDDVKEGFEEFKENVEAKVDEAKEKFAEIKEDIEEKVQEAVDAVTGKEKANEEL